MSNTMIEEIKKNIKDFKQNLSKLTKQCNDNNNINGNSDDKNKYINTRLLEFLQTITDVNYEMDELVYQVVDDVDDVDVDDYAVKLQEITDTRQKNDEFLKTFMPFMVLHQVYT